MTGLLSLVLGALFLALALISVVRFAAIRRRAVVDRVELIIERGLRPSQEAGAVSALLDAEPHQSIMSAAATWVGGLVSGRFTAVTEKAVSEQLIAAGLYMVSPRTVLGYRALLVSSLPVASYLLVGVHNLLAVLVLLLCAFAGWALPLTYVQRKARQRLTAVDRTLPDLIDLLTVTIEAGLSFTAAMRQASNQFGPPLGDELRLTLQEQTMGLSIEEALNHMAQRADTPAMRSFVRAMSQGERMGISVGQIMRNLSHEMRHRRRAQAEERAQKTPILILFPLVFMIFPAMFIMIITPAVIELVNNLKHF
ncbi:MAG: type II secretion system F family protein [Solirubrobacteraceae bacterium]